MAQGNYKQHWVRKEFPLLQEVVSDLFSKSDENKSNNTVICTARLLTQILN